jgi:hypothetical protein
MVKFSIQCAICRKPVDRTQWTEDLFNNRWKVVVFCHGAQDMCFVGKDFIEDIALSTPVAAVAFQSQLLQGGVDG